MPTLYESTVKKLNHSRFKSKQGLIALGVSVSPAWVSMFRRGLIPNASANRVQRLHDFLVKYEPQKGAKK